MRKGASVTNAASLMSSTACRRLYSMNCSATPNSALLPFISALTTAKNVFSCSACGPQKVYFSFETRFHQIVTLISLL